MTSKIFLKGYLTGLFLQLAIGPIFLIILNITLENGLWHGLFAVSGVAIVDYLYIICAIFGVGKLLETPKYKKIFTIISSIILTIFGVLLIQKGILNSFNHSNIGVEKVSLSQSFMTTFILTISSPLTIIFWTSIFTNKSIEYSLTKKQLVPFGIAAGLATISFLCIVVFILSQFNSLIPELILKLLNIIVGIVLITISIQRLLKTLNEKVI